MVRYLFPSVSLKKIDDEEFAILANDAEWLFSKLIQNSMGGLIGMAGAGAKVGKTQKRGSAPRNG